MVQEPGMEEDLSKQGCWSPGKLRPLGALLGGTDVACNRWSSFIFSPSCLKCQSVHHHSNQEGLRAGPRSSPPSTPHPSSQDCLQQLWCFRPP